MAEDGWSFGITTNPVDATNIEEFGWDGSDIGHGTIDRWEIKGTGNPANWTSATGELRIQDDESVVSPVMDRGNTNVKHISITRNGGAVIVTYWRGQAGTFNQEDASPAWELYPAGGANKNWRYFQVMLKQADVMQIDGQDLQIDGVTIVI